MRLILILGSILLFGIGTAIPAYGKNSPALVIDSSFEKRPLEPYITFLEDPLNHQTIESIKTDAVQRQFKTLPNPTINFGFTSSTYWFHFTLLHSLEEINTYLLEIDYPMLDTLIVYTIAEAGEITILQLGDKLPFNQRPIDLRNFVIPLALLPQETKQVYLQIKSTSNLSFPIKLWRSIRFLENQQQQQWLVGIFYGIALGLLAYNTFLFISVREKAFAYYLIYTICSIGFYSVYDGISFQIFPLAIAWQNTAIMVFFCGSYIAALQFARYYLDTIHNNPIIDKISLTLVGIIFLCLAAIAIVPAGLMTQIIVSVGIVVVSHLMVVGIIRWRQGNPLAKVYLVAWTTAIVTAATAILAALGIIGNLSSSVWAMKFGWVMELMLLSLGLGLRINILKSERVIEHQKVLAANQESKHKGEFLARMSHEIRTPLNGVLGMLKLLSNTELKVTQQQYIQSIENAGEALVEVIDDILNYSKIEAGKMQLEHTEFDLEQLVSETIQMFEYKTEKTNLRLTVSIDPNIPTKLLGDPTRIRQILINLLSNAFKFTKEGYVVVQVKLIAIALKDSPGNINDPKSQILPNVANLHFEVADTGIGISKDDQQRLFQSFNQAHSSTTRKFGGTGLGLVICKELCELMNGKIGFDSIEGQSSCFWFQLPLELANGVDKWNESLNSPNTASSDIPNQLIPPPSNNEDVKNARNTLRVLVVEDNSTNIKVIRGFLNKLNITPDVTTNGLKGVERYITANELHHLILMDCEMPEMNGFEAARAIRQWEIKNGLPKSRIIALSAHAMEGLRSQATESGMDGYLTKPLKFEQLQKIIDDLISDEKGYLTLKTNTYCS